MRKKTITTFIVVLCILLTTAAKSQQLEITPTLDLNNFRRDISPQVALMNQYGDYPVDYQYGLVDISIPLYTVNTVGGLTMPLQLKFHASGLRSDEREGLLGIRWALAGGGHVSRIIKGYPDEMLPFNSQVIDPNYIPDFYTLFGTTRGNNNTNPKINSAFIGGWRDPMTPNFYYPKGEYMDTEYDVFSYCLPTGRSGKFILKSDANGNRSVCLMPYEAMKVYVNKYRKSSYAEIKIIDENGVTYIFGGEHSPDVDIDEDGWVTTWHLTSIISANKKDTILINYLPSNRNSSLGWSLVVSDNLHNSLNYAKGIIEGYGPFTYGMYKLAGKLLSSGYFNENNYSFKPIYHRNIASIQWDAGAVYFFSYSSNDELEEIHVVDAQDNIVKKIDFSMKLNQSNRLRFLDKINFTSTDDPNKKETYSFDYYDATYCKDLYENFDWWGYYSNMGGVLENESIVVRVPSDDDRDFQKYTDIRKAIPKGGNKQADEESMKIGMIQRIKYPTGGVTEFTYEANRYGQINCGGLRIKEITNISETGKTREVKSYEYGTGYLPDYLRKPTTNIFSENEIDCYATALNYGVNDCGYGTFIQRVYQGTFPSRYSDFFPKTVRYTQVTETIKSGSNNIGKTVYGYSRSMSIPNFSYYNTIDGYNDFTGYNNKYKHGHVSPEDFWKYNKLGGKTVYDSIGNRVKEYIYQYDSFKEEYIWDMPVFRYRKHWVGFFGGNYSGHTEDTKELSMIHPDIDCSDCLGKTFAIKHQKYTTGAERLVKETENTYNPDGSVTSIVKDITYDPTYLLPVTEKTTNSDGKITTISYEYPFASRFFYDEPYDKMISNNYLTPVIYKSRTVNDRLVESVTTEYKKFDDYDAFDRYSYYPSEVRHNPSGRSMFFNKYTILGQPMHTYIYNHLTQNVVYLWSYNHQHPVAVIENATYNDVVNSIQGGETTINNIASSITLSDNDREKINALRTALPNALVTTYTYKPLVGVITITDPRGITTYYDYDGFGRLKEVYYNENNDTGKKRIVENYDYHYKNP